jgi:hypothetical protein
VTLSLYVLKLQAPSMYGFVPCCNFEVPEVKIDKLHPLVQGLWYNVYPHYATILYIACSA